MIDCTSIEDAEGVLNNLKLIQDTWPESKFLGEVKKSFRAYISAFEDELEATKSNCAFIQSIDCDALYLARSSVSEGDLSGGIIDESYTANGIAALILQQINRRYVEGGPDDFYNFEVVASALREIEGYEDVTQKGEPQPVLSDKRGAYEAAGSFAAYEGYIQYCEDNYDSASNVVWNADQRFKDALIIARAMLWSQINIGDPLSVFSKDSTTYWEDIYSLYYEYSEDVETLLQRLGLDIEGDLAYLRDHPELTQEVSFDRSVYDQLSFWQNQAEQEIGAFADTEIPGSNGMTLRDAIRQGYYPYELFEQMGRERYGSTFAYLLPLSISTPPLYFLSDNSAIMLTDLPNPIHTAWQCPQDNNGVNYKVGGKDGPCLKCPSGKARFRNGYVISESCCSDDNENKNDCYCKGEVETYDKPCED